MIMRSSDWTRVPTTTAIVLLSSLSRVATSHALPRETKTVALRELNVVDYPHIAATPAPISPFQLGRRDFNTICGYIGGDAALPATCLAGSHCVVDVDHGAVGCCPDGVPCTQGIFTGCVDVNSPPQTVLNPYVFTCTGADVCYKNNFEGGYYQYGCGSTSNLATTVITTAFSHSALDFSRITVALTAHPITLATPTRIGSRLSSQSVSSATSTWTPASTASTDTATATSTDSSASKSGAGLASSKSTAEPSAPDKDEARKSSGSMVGGIIGGVVGGISVLLVITMFALFFFRRRRQQQPTAYINPITGKDEGSSPSLHRYSEMSQTSSPPREAFRPPENVVENVDAIGLAVPLEPAPVRPSDEVSLNRHMEDPQDDTESTLDNDPYPGPRRGGGGSFWSQTRSQPRSRDRSRA